MVNRAHALLQSAAGKTDEEIAEALQVHPQTVRNWRKRFVEEGGLAAADFVWRMEDVLDLYVQLYDLQHPACRSSRGSPNASGV
jgi:transposase